MKCFQFDLNHIIQIELFNKEHLVSPRKHVSRRIQTYIFYFITKGTLHLKSSDAEFLLTEGDVCLFEPGETQEPLSAEECEYFYVHFDTPAITNSELSLQTYLETVQHKQECFSQSNARGFERYDFLKAHIMKKMHLSDKNVICYLSELFEKNCIRFGEGSMEKRLRTSWAFADILLKIEQFTGELLWNDNTSKSKVYKTVNAIRQYLDHHFYENIDSREIERRFSFQYDYVNRLFRQVTGESIAKYKNRQRIEAAKFLLTTTEKEIETIVDEIGFRDSYYFIRYFKRNVGCTPLQFRDKEKA